MKIPVYIKPHGTISHKSSLRFTKDHYFDLPDDIKDLLNQMFQGELADQTKPIDLINVLTVGFNLDSIEFNEILKKNKEKIRLYSITYDEKPEFYLSEDTQDKGELYKDKDGKYRLLPTKFGRGPDDDISVTLGDVFHDLFKQVNQRFKDPYLPRGITRHLIFTKAFYREEFRKKGENETPLKSYEEIEDHYSTSSFFKSRSVLELAIALAGGRGKIELKELMTDRLGEVYRLYRKYHEKEKQKGLPDSLYDMAEIFQLKEEISFSRNVHNISEISDREKKEFQDEYLNLFGPENDAAIRELDYAKRIIFRLLTAKQTPEMLRDAFVDKHNKEELDLAIIHEMAGYFQNIYQTGYYQDVNAKFSDSRLYIFDHYFKDQILHTSLSYSYRFNEVFLDTDHWDYLFFISDTGSILERLAPFLEKEGALQNKKIYLITCAEAIKKDTGHYKPINQIVEERTNDLFEYPQLRDNIIHRTLPYSDHHHHISIFLKKVPKDKPIYELSRFPTIQIVSSDGTFENYIFSRSIYFYQKGFHSEINPIWVRGAFAFLKNENTPLPSNFATNLLVKDHIMLLETFYAYHRKAKAFCGTDGQSIEYLLPKHFDLGENPSKELYDRRFDISEVFNLLTTTTK
ncbi:MAG: hypothetical protein IPJ82_22555 [Lewinellaceae bacterium]|nr:hypothetical protein [Lewinellaceae bacterium]